MEELIGQTIARRVRERRTQMKLSLQTVAERAGIAKSHLWEIEQGKSINPTIITAIGLSAALGVSLDYLTGRVNSLPDLHPAALKIATEIDWLLKGRSNAA